MVDEEVTEVLDLALLQGMDIPFITLFYVEEGVDNEVALEKIRRSEDSLCFE